MKAPKHDDTPWDLVVAFFWTDRAAIPFFSAQSYYPFHLDLIRHWWINIVDAFGLSAA